jgi:phytoene synthase
MHGQPQPSNSDYAYCGEVLRRGDRDRWLASLFIPQALRPHIHALYAFSLEIARVREIVSEPLLGEIRFQWWRDALGGKNETGFAASPAAAALIDTLARFRLPREPLIELIDARLRDLYNEAVESVQALESYAQATCSTLFRLAALVLEGEETSADAAVAVHAGIAYGITGLLRALPWHSARSQVFVPAEFLRAHGAEPDDLVSGRASPAVCAALADMRGLARTHLKAFEAQLRGLPQNRRAAFLAVSLCEPYLRLMERPDYDPFKTVIELPQWRRQWILWRASRRWG